MEVYFCVVCFIMERYTFMLYVYVVHFCVRPYGAYASFELILVLHALSILMWKILTAMHYYRNDTTYVLLEFWSCNCFIGNHTTYSPNYFVLYLLVYELLGTFYINPMLDGFGFLPTKGMPTTLCGGNGRG